jgi:hypothetical protein
MMAQYLPDGVRASSGGRSEVRIDGAAGSHLAGNAPWSFRFRTNWPGEISNGSSDKRKD